MRSFLLITAAFLLQFKSFAQFTDPKFSDTLPERLVLDVDKLRDHIYKGIPVKLKTGEYERKARRFAHDNACGISSLISDGSIYSNWPEIEAYINEMLQKIMPPELKNDSVIHAYVIEDGSMNAFMTPSGHTFVHTGMIASVNTEATLASVLCHELAHYYLRHSLNTFIKRESGDFDTGLFETANHGSRNSIKNELQADSLAMVWLYNSGYSIEGMISSFEAMQRNERNILKQRKDDWELKESTHPLSSKRLEIMREFYNKNKSNKGKDFLVNEALFRSFKEQVKPEILKHYLNNFNYETCLENAFRFHLFDPDNTTYVYYMMESIRRKCYLDPESWSKNFITDYYYDSLSTDNHRHKQKMTDHLFKKFDFEILEIAPYEAVKIKARFYWRDTPKFTTNEEAFVFFFKLGEALNCHECVLTNALSFTKDKEARNKLLSQYLSFPDIKHSDFASSLKNETIYSKLSAKKLLCFNMPNPRIKQAGDRVTFAYKRDDEKSVLSKIFDSVMITQSERIPLLLPAFKFSNLNKYKFLSQLETFSFLRIISKGEKTQLHILNPDYWEFFKIYDVNEIEFINSMFYDEYNSGDEKGIGYLKVGNSSLNELFLHSSNTRTFQIFISSVRLIDNSLMKIRYGSDDYQLKIKDDVKSKFVSSIKYELSIKEKRAKESDANNRYREAHY
jgi:hypothetical protein